MKLDNLTIKGGLVIAPWTLSLYKRQFDMSLMKSDVFTRNYFLKDRLHITLHNIFPQDTKLFLRTKKEYVAFVHYCVRRECLHRGFAWWIPPTLVHVLYRLFTLQVFSARFYFILKWVGVFLEETFSW